ncbi:MAG: hypothetical protein R3Y58_07510 [Eubacteriales bacterium]
MKKISNILFLGGLGGTIYYGIEIIFRGFSHWTMFVLGGICMIFIGLQGQWCEWKTPYWIQLLRSITFVSCSEFLTGMLVNKLLNWNVWDYSDRRLQLWGQVSLLFTILFAFLCAFAICIAKWVSKVLYNH